MDRRALFLFDDVVAERDALVANVYIRSADQLPNVAPTLSAERTGYLCHFIYCRTNAGIVEPKKADGGRGVIERPPAAPPAPGR